MGKQHREPFPKLSYNRANDLLEVIHSDVCGPMPCNSLGGARYFVTFTDDFSGYNFVYFLKSINEVMEKFVDYKILAEKQTSKQI